MCLTECQPKKDSVVCSHEVTERLNLGPLGCSRQSVHAASHVPVRKIWLPCKVEQGIVTDLSTLRNRPSLCPADEPVELVTATGPGASAEAAPVPPPVSEPAPAADPAAEDDEPPPPEPFQFQPPAPREPPTAGEEGG